jgi:hypothetical protein
VPRPPPPARGRGRRGTSGVGVEFRPPLTSFPVKIRARNEGTEAYGHLYVCKCVGVCMIARNVKRLRQNVGANLVCKFEILLGFHIN